jgi:hypothetical protein
MTICGWNRLMAAIIDALTCTHGPPLISGLARLSG